jgi:hypothetical protein
MVVGLEAGLCMAEVRPLCVTCITSLLLVIESDAYSLKAGFLARVRVRVRHCIVCSLNHQAGSLQEARMVGLEAMLCMAEVGHMRLWYYLHASYGQFFNAESLQKGQG